MNMKLYSSLLLLSLGMIAAANDDAESKNLRGRDLQLVDEGNGNNGNGNGSGNNGNGNGSGNNGNGGGDKVTVILTLKKSKSLSPTSWCNGRANVHGGSVKYIYSTAMIGCAMTIPLAALASLKSDVEVELVEEDAAVHAIGCNIKNDGSCDVSNPTWGLDRIDQCALPLSGTTFKKMPANGVTVFVLDTGIYSGHDEFQGMIDSNSDCHQDFAGEGNALNDGNGHGTHVSGTIVGNTYGVSFCKTADNSCELCSVKVLNKNGSGMTSDVIKGIDHVAAYSKANPGKKCVANMSLGGGFSTQENDAVNGAVAAGATFIVAAGNAAADACNDSPASAAEALTVGSTAQDDTPSSFSNWGACVDVWGPGSSILSAYNTGPTDTAIMSGTSMASPHVTGVAAAIQGASSAKLTPAEVRSKMLSDSASLGSYKGYARDLVTTVGGCRVPTPSPTPVPTPNGCKLLKVTVKTDNYPGETSWTVTNICGSPTQVVMSGGPYTEKLTTYTQEQCEYGDGQYSFTIKDSWGDGICCGYGSGSYSVVYGGVTVASGGSFGSSETTTFGSCAPTTASPTKSPTLPPTRKPTNSPTMKPTQPPTNTCVATCSNSNPTGVCCGGRTCKYVKNKKTYLCR